jgi:hypothetical protein
MKRRIGYVVIGFLSLVLSLVQLSLAQTPSQTASTLPRLVRFGGTVKDLNGTPLTGVVGITFTLYSEQTGGAPLWLETQNVTADSNGHYTVLLGSTKPDGLPVELFTSEQARWVGVQVSGHAEQPRVLLVSVPYALKASDAQTLGGLPPSAFAPASSVTSNSASSSSAPPLTLLAPSLATAAAPLATISGSGKTNFIPIWTNSTTLGNSVMSQVAGNVSVGGALHLPSKGTATASAGANSQPFDLFASSFKSGTSAITQDFRWQAEPVGNDTASPSGKLNLLFASGGATPAETGFSINNEGILRAPLGMLVSHVSFGGIVPISGTAGCNCGGSGTIVSAREGAIILKTGLTDFSAAGVGGGGSSLGLNRPGTFFSVRTSWVSPGGIKAGHVHTVVAGNALGGSFGFKAVGTTLEGMTTAPFSGPETDVNLATTLTAFTSVDLLAVRRASSVEFYVNGVLKGSSTTNLPTGVDDMTLDLYELSVTNGASNSTDAELAANMLTVGIPMF